MHKEDTFEYVNNGEKMSWLKHIPIYKVKSWPINWEKWSACDRHKVYYAKNYYKLVNNGEGKQ